MQFSLHTKAHTFASRTSPSTDQSLQKSVLFTDPKRNSFFFFPSFGVLIFLPPTADTTRQRNPRQTRTTTTRQTERQLVTRVWQKWRFSAPQTHLRLIKVWFSASTFVVKIATFAKPENVLANGLGLKFQIR
jgi:hypothetical protein